MGEDSGVNENDVECNNEFLHHVNHDVEDKEESSPEYHIEDSFSHGSTNDIISENDENGEDLIQGFDEVRFDPDTLEDYQSRKTSIEGRDGSTMVAHGLPGDLYAPYYPSTQGLVNLKAFRITAPIIVSDKLFRDGKYILIHRQPFALYGSSSLQQEKGYNVMGISSNSDINGIYVDVPLGNMMVQDAGFNEFVVKKRKGSGMLGHSRSYDQHGFFNFVGSTWTQKRRKLYKQWLQDK